MSSSLIEAECSICEFPLQANEEKVTTECGHTFHRSCAQERLDQKHKSDCRICGKQLALANALRENQTITIITQRDSNHRQTEERKKDTATVPIATNQNNQSDDEENNWECENCSMKNAESTKRCESCGEPQHAASATSYAMIAATDLEDTYDQKSQSDEEQQDDYYHHHEARAKDEQQRMKREKEPYDYPDYNYASESQARPFTNYKEDKPPGSVHHDYIQRSLTPPSPLRSLTPASDITTVSSSRIYHNLDSHTASGAHPISRMGLSSKSFDTEEAMPQLRTETAAHMSSAKTNTSKRTVQTTSSQPEAIVYIPDLPMDIDDNTQLEHQIRHRLEKSLKLKLDDIKCYSKLGIGLIRVHNDQIKDKLINDFGRIALDPGVGKTMISFVAELELISYIVLEVAKEKKDVVFPTAEEVARRWIELYKGEKPRICEQLSIQFPNIFKIVSTSLDELLRAMQNPDFSIKNEFARIYFHADCSFFEDLPRSITEEKLRQAISKEIRQPTLSSSSIWLQLNKQTSSACILVTGTARLWSNTSYLCIDEKLLSKKNNLTYRLRVYSVPQSFDVDKITKHQAFANRVVSSKQHGENLILELSDKTAFDEHVKRGVLCIDNHNRFRVEAYTPSNNPEASQIDEDTWYDTEMSRYKPDILQFVADPEHVIFRYRWNSQIWLKQFKRTTLQNHAVGNGRDQRNTPSDQTRHQLRVTVMLNTLAVVRKKNYTIDDQEIKLKINNRMKTIIYDQRSKLERGGKLPLIKTPYSITRVDVIKEDCLLVYERLVNSGYNPLLLNMANAKTPGGGYQKGDGAQEENLFRRSDYFRSLDVLLDQWLSERSERFHCSSNCQLDPLSDHNAMYPMHEFGAIYTSGLTVFRQSEDTGYAFMKKPLEGVCSLAMAAYRDPTLDGNMLASKYAVGTRKKIENTFAIAYHHKHDSLVLSAFGCGAFKNLPSHVAQLFCSVIEQYAGFFKLITFAIIDDHNIMQVII